MCHRHESRGTLHQWVGVIVILATMLFASAIPGHARGGGRHGGGGHGFHGGHGWRGHGGHGGHGWRGHGGARWARLARSGEATAGTAGEVQGSP